MASRKRKLIPFNLQYGQKKIIIETSRTLLLQEVRRNFNIRSTNILLEQYHDPTGNWIKVTPETVDAVHRVKVTDLDRCDTEASESDSDNVYREKLKKKLLDNSTLTGKDRKYLIDIIASKEIVPGDIVKQSSCNCKAGKQRWAENICTEEKGIQSDLPYLDITVLLNFLKAQSRLGTERDENSISQVMSSTFSNRRAFILHEGPTVRAVYDIYPTLFDKKQLFDEFNRITGVEIADIFYKNLELYSRKIIENAPSTTTVMKVYEKSMRNVFTTAEKQYVTCAAALLVISSLFQEDIRSIILYNTEKPEDDFPVITFRSSIYKALDMGRLFNIYAERFKICETNDLIEAFLLYMAGHYIFDMKYPDSIAQTATLIEMLLLELKPELEDVTSVEEVFKMLKLM